MKTLKHLFTALLLLCSMAVSAHDFEVDGIYYNVTNSTDKTVAVTYSGSSYSAVANEYIGNVVIPESVIYNDVEYSVTSIGDYAFRDCSGLTSLTIGDGVTSIGDYAFYDCSGLTSIEIPSSVTSIGNTAFSYCTGVKELRIEDGEGILSLGYGASSINYGLFRDCPLETLYLGRDLSYATNDDSGYSPFWGIKTLAKVTIGGSVTSIGSGAFRDCSGLTGDLVIPDGVTSIGSEAFYYCSGLTSIEIPSSVTSIGSEAFYYCSGLTSIEIPSSVTSIGNSAFSFCTGVKELRIEDGEGILSLGYGASYSSYGLFRDCPLETLYLGRDLSYATNSDSGKSPFCGIKTLAKVTIGGSVTSIGNQAFYDCSSLKEVHISDIGAWCGIRFGDTYANPLYFAKNLYLNGELVTELAIPEGVEEIKNYAFDGYDKIVNVTIPNSVTSIGSSAFHSCSGLTSVEIPNSVTSIGSGAFYNCSGLTGDLVIPDAVTSIGHRTFYGCSGLTSVEIPNSVTSIGDDAFSACSGFTGVRIGNDIASIGDNAFYNAKAVIDIAAESPATVGSNAFHADAVIVVPDAAVDAYKTAWSSYATQITDKGDAYVAVDVEAMDATSGIMEKIGIDKVGSIAKLTVKGSINGYDVIQFRDKMPLLRELDLSEATVVASDKAFYNGNCTKDNDLGGYAFYGLSKLNYVKLPKDLVSVGDYMFYKCSSLREIELPETVESIGSCAFYNCDALKEITIPAGVNSINYQTFNDCAALERVILPDGLETIGSYAFNYCRNLKEIKLPPTVKTIVSYAFQNCSSLEEIRIPSSVTSIGSYAFANCSKLDKVYTYTVEPTAIQENTFSTFQTATLYVPSFSFSNYYWDDGWKRFLNLAEFNEPYEYFYVNNDYTLNDDTGYIEGAEGENPDADINAGGGFIVEGEQGDDETPNQSLGDVNVGSDGEGTSGSIIGDNNLHIDDLHIRINVKGGRWYFFAFPFDIFFKDITMENGSDYIFRYYDGAERAQNGKGGWKDINENHLKAARGYIFQCAANDVLVLNIEDVKFKKEDKYNELVAHASGNLKDASWNFTGNPYLSYYDMADMDYSAPITVWDGSKYVAIRPGDDDYHFAPYEAFFVQKPEGHDAIGFEGEMQMTKKQSNKQKEKQAAARRARGIDPERLLINLVLGNDTSDDRTRIVFNENQSLAYETACDATKFETAGVAQLYTIGSDNVHYAINERPADNGRVVLGYTAPTAGFYTIEAQRMDVEVYIKDFKTGTLHNLKDGAYSFSSDAGTFNERFEILLKGTAPGTTGIDEVKGENGNVKTEIYDLQGRKMQDAGKGIYIINGEKVVK